MKKPKTAFIIFGRYPLAGKVKTRLAASIGDIPAANFYRECAEHTFQQLTPFLSDASIYFYFSDKTDFSLVQKWLVPYHFLIEVQSGYTLGERMKNAMYAAFRHDTEQVIILGTDVPDISTKILQSAVSSLKTAEVVIGPAYDGGYYLIGMKQLHEYLFENITWSTNSVLKTTLEKAQSRNLEVHLLPLLRDIDTLEDLQAWSNNRDESTNNKFKQFLKK